MPRKNPNFSILKPFLCVLGSMFRIIVILKHKIATNQLVRRVFFSIIPLYMRPFILPSIICNSPGHLEEKHPHNIIEPRPNFTVGMVLVFLNAEPSFRYKRVAEFLATFRFSFRLTRLPCPKVIVVSIHSC